MQTVWQIDKEKFIGYEVPSIDAVSYLFKHSSSQSKRDWLNVCLWTKVMETREYSVFMGYRSPVGEDINVLATRILVDQDKLDVVVALQDRDNFVAHCVRGPAIFYRLRNQQESDVLFKGNSPSEFRSIALHKYSWTDFENDWPYFFRKLDLNLPYLRLEQYFPYAPINEWLAIAARNECTNYKKYLEILCLTRKASTKYLISAALLAVILRKMDKRKWDRNEISWLLRDDKNNVDDTQ